MNLKDILPGCQISFAREGDVVDAITVAVDARPDTDPATNYTDLGTVQQFEPQKQEQKITRRASRDGQPYRTRRTIITSQEMMWNFQMQEWSEMTLVELLFNSDKPVAGKFVPNSRQERIRGWLRCEKFDTIGKDKILDMFVWVELYVESYQFQEGLEPYALKAEVLDSALNDADVTNL